jgi:hypothetical protein
VSSVTQERYVTEKDRDQADNTAPAIKNTTSPMPAKICHHFNVRLVFM